LGLANVIKNLALKNKRLTAIYDFKN